MKVSDAEPDLHTVLVFERGLNGSVGNKAAASLLLTGSDGAAAPLGRMHVTTRLQRRRGVLSPTKLVGLAAGVPLAGGSPLLVAGGLGGTLARRRMGDRGPHPV